MPAVVKLLTLLVMCLTVSVGDSWADSSNSMRVFMDGTVVPCTNEGEEISTSHIRDSQCYHCICQNQTAVCTLQKCPSLTTCPIVERNQSNVCCKRCKTCNYLGQTYQNDQQWWSGQDSCRMFTCKAGVITQARVQCVAKCSNPVRLVGYCCPVCPSSSDNSKTSLSATTKNDPCLQCQCDTKWCHCFRTACPALDCEADEQYTPSGSCCPECKAAKEGSGILDGCIYQNVAYLNEQSFRPDPCTLCKCQDGSVFCRRFLCPLLNCPKARLYFEKNLCCPRCRDKDPLSCKYEGQEFKHGDIWQLNACSKCVCANGETICTTLQCRFAKDRCPKGYRWSEPVKGQCCGVCEEKESTCTVFGDPHYQTFDGRTYNFQGTCRYVLAKNCHPKRGANEFSVIVQNEPRGQEQYTWTRHVSLRLPGGKRLALLPGKRVRFNRKPLKLPHIEIGEFSVMIDPQGNVIARVVDGPRIVWDGNSYVEVTVSSNYRKAMCGLCGNYDGNPDDDFQMHTDVEDSIFLKSASVITKNANAFGQSWKIGSWKACKSLKDKTYHQQIDQQKRKARRKNQKKKPESSSNPLLSILNSLNDSLLINEKLIRDKKLGNILESMGSNNTLFLQPSAKKSQVRISNSETNDISELIRRPNEKSKQKLFGGKNVDEKADKPKKLENGNLEKTKNLTKFMNSNTAVLRKKRPMNRKRRRLKRLCPDNKYEKRLSAMSHCDLLNSDLFEPCHNAVNVRHYFKSCVMDSCACPPTGRCYCEAMLAYSRKCEKENVQIDWRKKSNCDLDAPQCPMENGIFKLCTLPCNVKTCSNYKLLSDNINCFSSSCIPGCQCPNGTVLHSNKCISPADCPKLLL